nr:TadE/TadG family type IV pilus assembly protein [Sphingomonas sp. TZW2008]
MVQQRHGNVLTLFAFALVPLLALAGSAVDISRAYLIKSRLQQACDAAALAGRRGMTGASFDAVARKAADDMFALNFTRGRYGTTDLTMTYNVGADLIVHGMASVVVPTVIMGMFGKKTIPLEATCDAMLQLPNSDIMFVLDTTLSMAETNVGDTQSKIAALRQSVTDFYTILNNAQSAGSQVRYGFVPYSSTVNVGQLLRREWMVDQWAYQSREQNEYIDNAGGTQGNTTTTTTYSPWSGGITTSTSYGSSENCVAPPNESYTDTTAWQAWSPNGTAVPRSRTGTQTRNGSTYSASRASNGVCTITKTTYNGYSRTATQTVEENPNAGQTTAGTRTYYWNYKKITYTVSVLKGSSANGLITGGYFELPIGNNFAVKRFNWGVGGQGACIEERTTVRTGDTGTEYDLDVDMVPNPANPDTQWRPFLPDIVWSRSVTNYYPAGGAANITGWQPNDVIHVSNNYITPGSYKSDFAACPSASRKLATIRTATEQTSLTSYLNSLVPRGRTYHDIGMLWGLRLLSAEGLFASENSSSPNGGNIARNIIFMTDGDTETNIADYDAYGLSALDRRRTPGGSLPSNSDQDGIVEDRLRRLCTVAKDQKNITVWVIAFGTSLTSLLSDCASSGRAYQANNAAELNQTFADIAARISQLRVTH